MADEILNEEDFQNAVRQRYDRSPAAVSREELERLLAEPFHEARIVAELIEQQSLIFGELAKKPDPDLAAQGQKLCQQVHQFCQKLALDLPHVDLEQTPGKG